MLPSVTFIVTGVEGKFGNGSAAAVVSNNPDITASVAIDIDKFFSFMLFPLLIYPDSSMKNAFYGFWN
jgi:hypothetical protein